MKLSDKDYFLLNIISELMANPDEYIEQNVKDIANHVFNSLNETDQNKDLLSLLQEIQANDRIGHFELSNGLRLKETDIYVYQNDSNNRILIFTCKRDSNSRPYSSILGNDSKELKKAAVFLHTNKGDQRCMVSGHSIGGAYAIYAASTIDCVDGVVFDAPGVGKLLTKEQMSRTRQVKNYLAYNSLLSAIGEHPEEIVFAKKTLLDHHVTLSTDHLKDAFSFDEGGLVVTDEKGELYELLSRLNQILEENTLASNEVIQAFAEALKINAGMTANLGYSLFAHVSSLDNIDEGMIRNALIEIGKRYELEVNNIYLSSKRALQDIPLNDLEEIEDKFTLISESTMKQIAQMATAFYQGAEAMLSLFVIFFPEEDSLTEEIAVSLDKFITGIDKNLNKIAQQLSEDIQGRIEAYLASFMGMPEVTLDL